MTATNSIASLRTTLVSAAEPLDVRFRALFSLKGLAAASHAAAQEAIDAIGAAFADDSALLKHELAYVLGQMQDVRAIPTLEAVLKDEKEHAMVRHEAAEALGAISSPTSLPILRAYESDADVSVRETCGLAIKKIEWDNSEEGAREKARKLAGEEQNAFAPIDPAPALSGSSSAPSISDSRTLLTDASAPLFERYRAMFALRNAVHTARRRAEQPQLSDDERREAGEEGKQAVLALADGLRDASALFRHEICFVFGELAHPASVPSMIGVLADEKEHEMVRHEAAEALGAVAEEEEEGDEHAEVLRELKRWAEDEKAPRVVRESCVVALDELKYNNDPTQFQRIEPSVADVPAVPVAPVA